MLFAMTLAGCGTDPKDVDYGGMSYEDLQTASTSLIETLLTLDEETAAYIAQNGTEQDKELIENWKAGTDDLGECSGYDTFTVTKSGNTLTTEMMLHYAERDVSFQLVYDSFNMMMTGATIEPVKTMGEKMSAAGLNTIVSISIVFAVLILISLIIYAFNIFPYLEKKKKEQNMAAAEVNAAPSETVAAPVEEDVMDDIELIAVIAAAIAASEGTSTSDFVVRSINRR